MPKLHRRDAPALLAHWGLEVRRVERVRSVLRVSTDRGVKCLKPIRHRRSKALFPLAVVEHVCQNGFTLLPRSIPTLAGEPFLSLEERAHLLLTDWLAGEEPSYGNSAQLAAAGRTLARFHLASRGFSAPPEVRVKYKLGKWPAELEERMADLVQIQVTAQERPRSASFDQQVQRSMNDLLARARQSLERLANSPYRALCEQAAGEPALCHGDPAMRNFVWARDGEIHLIDFDSAAVDLPLVDLWKLCRRALRRVNWSVRTAQELFAAYSRVRPLQGEECQVLHALLTFPERQWKLLRTYYHKPHKRDWTERRWGREVSEALGQLEESQRFLDDFQRTYL